MTAPIRQSESGEVYLGPTGSKVATGGAVMLAATILLLMFDIVTARRIDALRNELRESEQRLERLIEAERFSRELADAELREAGG